MFPVAYTSWLTPRATPQRRPTPPRPTPPKRPAPKVGRSTWGYHRSTLHERLARNNDYRWQNDRNAYPFPSSVVHYEATTALQRLAERAAAKVV